MLADAETITDFSNFAKIGKHERGWIKKHKEKQARDSHLSTDLKWLSIPTDLCRCKCE